MTFARRFLIACAAWGLLSGTLAPAGDWPQFHGSDRGTFEGDPPPATWGEGTNVRWKVRVPGYGWSSPVVAGDRVYLTTAVAERPQAPKLKGPGGGEPAPPDETFRWEVHCLDAATGRTLWSQVAATHKPTIATHVSNTYASETPAADGERVYAYFGAVGVFCYDRDGKPLWTKDLGSHRMFGNWGTSSSPTQDDERVFVQCDNEERSFVVALDKRTGAERWRMDRPEKSTWGSPVLWRSKVRNELVLMGARRIRSYDPATGNVLWELATQQDAGGGPGGRPRPGGGGPGGGGGGKAAAGGCKSTPVATDDMIYLGMAPRAQGQQLGPMWAVRAGATGDVSLHPGETSNTFVAWSRPDAGPHFASAVVYQGLLYVVPPHDGVLRCFDATTGADVYQHRLPSAGDFKASAWAGDGKVYATDERGVTFVVRAGPRFELLGRNDLNDSCWATPAPAHGALFVRGVSSVYCVGR